jgi:hypothetical protein
LAAPTPLNGKALARNDQMEHIAPLIQTVLWVALIGGILWRFHVPLHGRAIQAEYGAPINRQVTAGRDSGFDGVFLAAGRTTVVEVKYVSGDTSPRRFRDAIWRITGAIQQYKWDNSQIVLALVFERDEDVETLRQRLALVFAENPVPVVIHCYTIAELQARFGLGDRDAG